MSFYERRNPYGAAIIREQEQAIGMCREFIAGEPDYPVGVDALTDIGLKIGSALQPAIEGLSRQYPAFCRLNSLMMPWAEGEAGANAYETWMSTGPEFKTVHTLRFTPPLPEGQTTAYTLGLAGYDWGEIDLSCYNNTSPDAPELLGVVSVRNTYRMGDGQFARQAVRKIFSDELTYVVGENRSIEYGLSAGPLTKVQWITLAYEVGQRFEGQAKEILYAYDVNGLLQYRLWSSLKHVFERLPDTNESK